LKNILVLFLSLCVLVGSGIAEEAYGGSIQVQTLLKTTVDAAGRPIAFPTGEGLELSEYLVELPVGDSTGWHLHPNPSIEHVLEGTLVVQDEHGVKRQYTAGESFAEVVNLRHCGVNTGKTPVRILVFVVGQKGIPLSIK